MRARLKDTELRLAHEITQINQLFYNIEYLAGFFKRNSVVLDEDNRICENMIGYLGQELLELRKMVEFSEKIVEKYEEKQRKSIKNVKKS